MDFRFIIGDLIENLAIKTNKGVNRIRLYRYKVLKRKGADFGGQMLQEELGYTKEEGNDYTPSWGYIRRLFYNRISNKDSIIDLGCGKGYAMYIMGRFKFKKIYGLDLSEKLCEMAKENMKVLYPGDNRFEVFCCDATKILQCKETAEAIKTCNYIYIYNSFPVNVLEKVVEEITYLVEKEGCHFTIFYAAPSPDCLDIVNANLHFKFIKEHFSDKALASVIEYYVS